MSWHVDTATWLTPHQETFARVFVQTGNASEAYRQAYNTENWKPESVWSQASTMLALPHVKARIEQLRQQVEAHFVAVTAAEVVGGIRRQIALGEENLQIAAALKGSELLGRTIGLFAADQVQQAPIQICIDRGFQPVQVAAAPAQAQLPPAIEVEAHEPTGAGTSTEGNVA